MRARQAQIQAQAQTQTQAQAQAQTQTQTQRTIQRMPCVDVSTYACVCMSFPVPPHVRTRRNLGHANAAIEQASASEAGPDKAQGSKKVEKKKTVTRGAI